MRSVQMCVSGLLLVGGVASADAVKPVSYDMPNGNTGSFSYWDDTYNGSGNRTQDGSALAGGVGQLTDDVLGANAWDANLGNGNAYEWVGWVNKNPVITFKFSDAVQFSEIALHANNARYGGVSLFQSFTASFSTDGVTFTDALTRTTTLDERADTTARFYGLSVPNIAAQYVRIEIERGDSWVFVSEVTFNAVPGPGATAAFGLAGLLTMRRRR